MFFSSIIRPLAFSLDPEKAHNLALKALSHSLVFTRSSCAAATRHIIENKKLRLNLAGLSFANPLGLAAGFDKNAVALPAMARLGFAFTEVGTITPLPQEGNEKPRLFRLPADNAIINRMGFNNAGLDAILQRLQAYKQEPNKNIMGVNIGVNKNCSQRQESYVESLSKLYAAADYITINVSSPNTPNLRELQDKEPVAALLHAISETRQAELDNGASYVPIFLKVAPDLTAAELEDIALAIQASDVDGAIVSNTTVARAGLGHCKSAAQSGGLSGKPLFRKSSIVLAKMRKYLGKDKVLIGVGGVDDSASFIEKMKAGADLVQLYTGLIYKGPSLPLDILSQTLAQLELEGLTHVSQYRDLNVEKWAGLDL